MGPAEWSFSSRGVPCELVLCAHRGTARTGIPGHKDSGSGEGGGITSSERCGTASSQLTQWELHTHKKARSTVEPRRSPAEIQKTRSPSSQVSQPERGPWEGGEKEGEIGSRGGMWADFPGAMRGLSVGRICLALLAALLGMCCSAEGGCQGKCCQGTDRLCTATDWRMDRIYGTCYCDDTCQMTKDCCFDYLTMCPAQPCVVSQWSHWSGCIEKCQPAIRVRRRQVEQQARNSPDICPQLEERAGCMDYAQHQGVHCGLSEGPAFITSAEYGARRPKYDQYGEPLDPGYCVEFRMEWLTPDCALQSAHHTRWMQYLREGYTVCVACQPPAMHNHSRDCKGEGTASDREALLQWQAVGNSRCRGTWKRLQRQEHCACPLVHSFVFT